jgi:6-phosphogluconolactonase
MSTPTATHPTVQLLIGTYTESLPHVQGTAEGVLGADFDQATGALGPVRVLAATRNPSWLTVDASGTALYAVDETGEGGVVAFAREPGTGALTALGGRPSDGADPCHLLVHPGGRFVVVANYSSGTVTVLPREPDGSLGAAVSQVRPVGSGPHPVRQQGPHAHAVELDPVTGLLLVADLGRDTVSGYALDEAGQLTPVPEAVVTLPPGTGPRHLAFSPDAGHLYLVGELTSTVTVLTRVPGTAGFRIAASHSTLRPGHTGDNLAAAIRITVSGRLLFVSNRGDDSIAVFRVDPADGSLTLAAVEPALGQCPRDLRLSPDGRHLLAACQDKGGVQVFAVDEDAATLAHRHQALVPTPVCLAFASN